MYKIFIPLFLFVSLSCGSTEPEVKEIRRYTESQLDPSVSPDGNTVVFWGVYDSVEAMHFVTIDGKYLRYIQRFHFGETDYRESPSWSPDGKKIAFTLNGNICVIDTNGENLVQLTDTYQDFDAKWSPDGNYITYVKTICDPECGIVIYDYNMRTIKYGPRYGGYPSWDGKAENIYYYCTYYEESKYKGFTFWRYNIKTERMDSLYFSGTPELWITGCAVSPVEDLLLFAASVGSPIQSYIWSLNLTTKEVKQLTTDGGKYPCWTPDGKKIVYTNTYAEEGGLWIMDKDGSNKHRLTQKWR